MTEKMMECYYHLDDNEIDKVMFTKDMVENILLYDKSLQLIGIINSTEMRSNIMKFTLTNKSTEIIQCLIWDAGIIEKYKDLIVTGNIIHLDGAFVRPRHASMSSGNIPYDVNVMSNTIIRLIKNCPKLMSSPESIKSTVSIEDCCKVEGIIQVEGYIKNVITETSLPSVTINQGCLSDCLMYKLEIRMPSLCNMKEFKVGSHVKATGVIKYAQYPYLWVVRKEDITLASNDVKKIVDVLKGRKIPKRSNTCEDSHSPTLKIIKKST